MHVLLPSLIVVFDLALPTVLLLWLWRTRTQSPLRYSSIVLVVSTYLVALKISFLGFWHVVGGFWPYLYFILFATIVIARLRNGFTNDRGAQSRTKESLFIGLNVVHASLWVFVIGSALAARNVDLKAVHLSSPLRGETFHVIGGGGNFSVNQHTRAIRYAMDIVELNEFGTHARSMALYPEDLTKYNIFGTDIVAPCAGEVIGAESNVTEQVPLHPSFDGNTNFVALFCEGHTIRLLHMKQGSVKVSVGDTVVVGQLLGNVGNSGNTTEPHLHIDAVAGRQLLNMRNDGGVKSVPILIDGRFLVKGDSFKGK